MQALTPPSLTHQFSYAATLAPPEIIGAVPAGIRANFYVTGGTIEGPRLTGRVLPAGGDWLTLRSDGMAMLDVRATLCAADGALILATYRGLGDLGDDGYQRFLRGELPPRLALRTAPEFHTSAPQYVWLQRLTFVGVGEVNFERSEVHYDVFSVG